VSNGGEDVISQATEWVIKRCTQRWVGFQLEYEDFPTPEGLMTRDLMLKVLERVSREHPSDEFRGHRVGALREPPPAAVGTHERGNTPAQQG
jgi:hypothetical protein